MTTAQHKIGSGFGAQSTADDVLRGIDLSGKLALVTGGYSGIGLQTTHALVRAGAQVVVPARRPGTAQAALGNGVEVDELDLADLASVHDFAERFLASGRAIDIVINSAGVMACPETRVGPGWEAQFATNHLGHYALVNRLWLAISRGGARVVAVSSAGHRRSAIRWDDVMFDNGYDKWQGYARSRCIPAGSLPRCSGTCPGRRWSPPGGSTSRATHSTRPASRRPSRAPRRRCGPRRPRNSTAWEASTARIAISPRWHPTTRSSPAGYAATL